MSAIDGVLARPVYLQAPDLLRGTWCRMAHDRLNQVAEDADVAPTDDSSRLVFPSDTHRGDASRADVFAANERPYVTALAHYFREGHTYVEVGDGDEPWQNRFADVRRAHPETLRLPDACHLAERPHLPVGNHDVSRGRGHRAHKGGLLAREGLRLRHRETGQELFAVPGHQVDLRADRSQGVSRSMVRCIWHRLLDRGMASPHSNPDAWRRAKGVAHKVERWLRSQFEERLVEWVEQAGRVLICGHTHLPVSPASGDPAYYNTGSCVKPGILSAIEMPHGEITQVRWIGAPWRSGDHDSRARRQPVGLPRPLRHVL